MTGTVDFGDNSEPVNYETTVEHTYSKFGKYIITVSGVGVKEPGVLGVYNPPVNCSETIMVGSGTSHS